MGDLEVILARIKKLQREREFDPDIKKKGKEGWKEKGFDNGLEWVENEILAMLDDREKKNADVVSG